MVPSRTEKLRDERGPNPVPKNSMPLVLVKRIADFHNVEIEITK